jgi:L-alanine-DL-glutamate epimerase-like enolase superfamily enzyme
VNPDALNGLALLSHAKSTDITVREVTYSYEDFRYRTPIKFGGVAIDRATILNVHCRVESRHGRLVSGFGSMPLGNVWAFPSRVLSYEQTLGAMKSLAEQVARLTSDCRETGHPIDLNHLLEPAYLGAAKDVAQKLSLSEPIPKLCTLVVVSAFDAALHDAFGKAQDLNCYESYGPDFLSPDLSHYLGPDFRKEHLSSYLLPAPTQRMPLYHLVGAVDPLDNTDIRERISDGLPETVGEWINHNGLTHLKIKLSGDDLAWDLSRVAGVDRVSTQTQASRGVDRWYYSLDFNERCAHVEYLREFLLRIKQLAPGAFERIQYIEQPTHRDLKTHRANRVHQASRLRPVVIDESLTDLESLLLARDMGYTGVALKACKGQSQALLMAAAAQKYGMFLCVQDLTCPGASLIHSAGLAAHVPGVTAVEANARQYMPTANKPWEDRYPGLFRVTDGTMETGLLTGVGLGAI